MEFVLLSLANYPVYGQDDVFCVDCDCWMSLGQLVGGVRWHMDQTEVARAVQLLQDGGRVQVVAYQFDVSPSVVSIV